MLLKLLITHEKQANFRKIFSKYVKNVKTKKYFENFYNFCFKFVDKLFCRVYTIGEIGDRTVSGDRL